MTRRFVILAAAAALLAGAGQAQAQKYFDFLNGGTSFYGGDRRFSPGGVSPIPRTGVYYPSNYAPGTIVINTAERRLYLLQPGARRSATASGSAATASAGVESIEFPQRRNGPAGRPPPRCAAAGPICPATWKAGPRTRSALAPSISARRFTASTVPTSRKRLDKRSLRAAFA
jgi:lipoprotein-anchoring transpeptidase ErfK/SrfK